MLYVEIFIQSSILVKMVMISLLLISLVSWAIILKKKNEFKKRFIEIEYIKSVLKNDEKVNQNDLAEYLNSLKVDVSKSLSMAKNCNYFGKVITTIHKSKNIMNCQKVDKEFHIALEKYSEIINSDTNNIIDNEIIELKKGINILATIGSVSPYIGLFGTVFGIVESFIAIAEAGKATLETIAPSIAEALIATGMGLFAAIPAYVFYNIYVSKLTTIEESYNYYKEVVFNKYKEFLFLNSINEN